MRVTHPQHRVRFQLLPEAFDDRMQRTTCGPSDAFAVAFEPLLESVLLGG